MNELLKKIIKNAFQEEFEKMQSDFIESLEMKDKSDEYLMKEYKHTQWKDLNKFCKNFLKSRYNLYEGFSIGFTFVDVYPNSYISDVIERALRLKEREEMMLNSLEKASNFLLNNDPKKKTKRKPKKLGDEAPKSKAKKLGEE